MLEWLENPESRPNVQTLLDTDISMPIIALTQLLHYWVTLKVAGKTPGEFRSLIRGTTGHSQGIVSSVVIASSETDEDFKENVRKAVGLLYWVGLFSRHEWETVSTPLDSKSLQDSLNNEEGVPTPMLGISGLDFTEISSFVEKANGSLASNFQIDISLINSSNGFICSSHPQSLHKLNTFLRDVKKPASKDEKPRITTRFLQINAPFHSRYLAGIAVRVQEEILRYDLEFSIENIGIPVYHTETGKDMRIENESGGVSVGLVQQICARPVAWEASTVEIGNVSYILDFGPGGIGGLVVRNLKDNSGGVKVILASCCLEPVSGNVLLDKSFLF
ncbi:UNVERIFIED_CONTAM: beta subunit of fatty acid synthetase [Siphonaria sp. JEL0065]|nr:beta subunit of fatty acid synthetase [Siphonaria sp. JEL0065]